MRREENPQIDGVPVALAIRGKTSIMLPIKLMARVRQM